jgi:hypothetical protein
VGSGKFVLILNNRGQANGWIYSKKRLSFVSITCGLKIKELYVSLGKLSEQEFKLNKSRAKLKV